MRRPIHPRRPFATRRAGRRPFAFYPPRTRTRFFWAGHYPDASWRLVSLHPGGPREN